MEKRIIRINASALKKSACFRNFWLTAIAGYKEPINSVQIEFGTSIHIFVKCMIESKGDFAASIMAARKYFETTKMIVPKKKAYLDSVHLVKVCVQYWQWLTSKHSEFEILTKEDNSPAVELTFSNHFYEDENFIVYLEGTIDLLGKFPGQYGQYAIGDHKSTGSYEQEEYLDSYANSTQLKFYHYNLLLYGQRNPDSFIASISKLPVGCFIYGIFLNGKDKIEFGRSEIFQFKKEQVLEFGIMLDTFIQKVIRNATDNMPQPEGFLNGACHSYLGGKCSFFNVCRQPDSVASGHVLRQQFVKTEYLPLRNNEERV